MEPVEWRGKGKGKAVAADDEGPKKYSPQETLWLAKNFVDVSEDPIIGNQQSAKCSGSGLPRNITLVDLEGHSSVAT